MPIQTIVNKELPIGVPGEFYDDSPRRVHGYKVKAEGETSFVAATGDIFFSQNPADNDTATVGDIVYTFKTSASAAYEVAIGESAEDTSLNLFNAINGEGVGDKNPLVSATSYGAAVTVVADIAGEAGNSIALAVNSESLTVSGATLSGGGTTTQEALIPLVAKAYTIAEEGTVRMGGTGAFAGIAVSPKEYALRGGLQPSMALSDGAAVSIADMGHIVVKVSNTAKVGQACFYDPKTGELSAGATGSEGGGIEIKGSKFVFFDAEPGGLAVLELTGFGAL